MRTRITPTIPIKIKNKKSGWAFVSTFYMFRPTTLNFQFFFLMTIASTSGFHQSSFLLCFFPPILGFSIVTFLMDDERVESREFWAVVGGGSQESLEIDLGKRIKPLAFIFVSDEEGNWGAPFEAHLHHIVIRIEV